MCELDALNGPQKVTVTDADGSLATVGPVINLYGKPDDMPVPTGAPRDVEAA